MTKQKGFTLIELLVVVAIIGILATVILASLGQARNRARDAAARAAISQARSEMELQFLNTGSYEDSVGSASCAGFVTEFANSFSANTGNTAFCDATATAYDFYGTLNDGTIFCVDSGGFAGSTIALGPVGSCS